MTDIETRLTILEKKLINISTQLITEQIRTEIYREIIKNNTTIILNEKGLKSPLIKQPKPKPSPLIKIVNNELLCEIPHLSLIDEVTEIKNNPVTDIMERFDNSKNVQNKNILELKKYRKLVFSTMKLSNYIELCNEHIQILTRIFKDKGFSDKKIVSTIRSTLTPLDLRLLRYNGYYNSHVDIDEIQRLQNHLEVLSPSSLEHQLFNTDIICDNMYNYGSVLFPVKTNLKRVLFNRRGNNNLIYLQTEKSNKADPYSFYYLSFVNKHKRCWKMDCRLEDLTNSISNNMIPYMIDNFRKMYKDVFGDNDYRVDYKKRCQLTDCDCEQLVKNIFTLADPKSASKLLCDLVRENATYISDDKDNFNILSDDVLQKKRLAKPSKDHLTDIPKLLFDTISKNEISDFSNNK